jgi:hypothetical protein
MRRERCVEILFLYAVAASACRSGGRGGAGPVAGEAGAAGADQAGAGPGGAGAGGAFECQYDTAPPPQGTDGKLLCVGSVQAWWFPKACIPREVRTQCYITELVDGQPQCLPASEPGLVRRLQETISSTGFETDFVLDAASMFAAQPACDRMIGRCIGLAGYQQAECFNSIDKPGSACAPASSAASGGQSYEYPCNSADADAGAEPAPSHGLCCYTSCGHHVQT